MSRRRRALAMPLALPLARPLALLLAVTLGLPLAVGLASPVPSASAAQAAGPALPPALCSGTAGWRRTNPAAQVIADRFAWGRYGPTRVGDGSGNIDWRADPHREVSWRMWLHSLRWLESLVIAGRNGDAAALDHAQAVVRDWAADHPYPWNGNAAAAEATMHRSATILCLRAALLAANGDALPPGSAWLDGALRTHAAFLTRWYSGTGNHGTDESLALFGIGCVLSTPAHRATATRRLAAGLDDAIDAQGATNEQSTGYAPMNHRLWGRVEATLSGCGGDPALVARISARRAALALFVAHAITPTGRLHQIGDTEDKPQARLPSPAHEYAVTRGASGSAPDRRVAVYRRGYVFGRTGWGAGDRSFAAESAYALRFGPARAHHGHADHTALTWSASGVDVLIDPGYGQLSGDAWQAFVRSPAAHNQLVVGAAPATGPTRLLRAAPAPPGRAMGDAYRLADSPGRGISRVRDVVVAADPDVILVVDRATSAARTTFTQYWHLPAGARAGAVGSGRGATAAIGRTGVTLLQLPVAGAPAPRGTTRVVTGSTRPVQGWHWPDLFTRRPAPVVAFARSGTSAILATAIVTAPAGTRVTATATRSGGGTTTYTITVGGRRAVIALSPGGSLTRVR